MMTEETPAVVELEGKTFAHVDRSSVPIWPSAMSERPQPTLTLKDDDLFLITDTLGNVPGHTPTRFSTESSLGLFCQDTRFLNRLELQIGGQLPILLSSTAQRGYALSVLCTNPYLPQEQIYAETISIHREIVLNGGVFEEVILTNYGTKPASFEISLSFDADFVDLFEVRGWTREQKGSVLRLMAEQGVEQESPEPVSAAPALLVKKGDSDQVCKEFSLPYRGLDGSVMETRIRFIDLQPHQLRGTTALWHLHLEPHGTCKLSYRVELLMGNRPASQVHTPATLAQAKAAEAMEEENWRQQITRIRSDNRDFNQVVQQAERDIYLLRQSFGQGKTVSAGIPWFCTLFGRDSLITASQVLVLDPSLAKETLQILAQYQGQVEDEWREEEPGKILHELRLGEMARCREIPHTPYYGSVDATPLWLMLLADTFAWTRDQELLDRLWPNALAAMDWIDRNLRSTGYLSYQRRSPLGLDNQGWKDSGDCIVDRQGRLASGPIALSEVQAYVYAAKLRLSHLAHYLNHIDLAQRWQQEAKDLQTRFNRDFWISDLDYCALALDGDGKPVDSITSNPGHCLSLGILFPDKAHSVAERLMAPDMFNGWGIRTLSRDAPAYNPMGYHVGSVWPHDTGLIAQGLRQLDLVDPALELAQGLIDMTRQQPYHRPPELFCGYERTDAETPVPYPVACSPQAWASGTIFQLIQIMINGVPDAPNNQLRIIDPALPPSLHQLSIHNLKVGGTILDLELARESTHRGPTTTSCRVAKKRGNLRVVIEA